MRAFFSRKQRLRSQGEFKQVLESAKKLRGYCITVFYCPNNLSYARLGISIGRNKVRHATDRNRLKRVIRNSFRLNQQDIQGHDIIIIGYSGIEQLEHRELDLQLERLWKKLIASYNKSSSG